VRIFEFANTKRTQIDCIWFCHRSEKIWELKSFVLRRGEIFCNLSPKTTQLTVFRSAAQRILFGICHQNKLKLTVSCSAAQRKFWNWQQKQLKLTVICSAAREFLEFATRIDCICLATQRKFWNLSTKATQVDCFGRAARIFGICSLKLTEFCFAAQRKFWTSRSTTERSTIDSVRSSAIFDRRAATTSSSSRKRKHPDREIVDVHEW
jgi:hypothetical protein